MRKMVITTLISLLVVSFFSFPVFAASNIQNVSISRNGLYTALDRSSQVTSSGVNSANVTVYNSTAYYSYVIRVEWEITFTDNALHSGYIIFDKTYTGDEFQLLSDSENVGVQGNYIYFSDKSSFNVYTLSTVIGSSNPPALPSWDLVLQSFTEISGGDVTFISNRVNVIYNRVNSIYSLLNNSQTGFSKIVPLLQDIADNGISATDFQSLLDKIGEVTTAVNNFSTANDTAISNAVTSLNNNINGLRTLVNQLHLDNTNLYNLLVQVHSILNTSISPTLTAISDYLKSRHDWDIPTESFFINWSLFNSSADLAPIASNSFWDNYPIFEFISGSSFGTFLNPGQEKTIILGVDKNISNSSSFLNYFSVTSGIDIVSFYNYGNSFPQFRFIRIVFKNSTSSGISAYFSALQSLKVVGIYLSSNLGMSESFQSVWFPPDNSAIENANDQLGDSVVEYENLESDFQDDMTESLNDVDMNSPLLTDTDFRSSLDWVRMRFNDLTVGNYFGSFIQFSLILGLSLMFIGGLRK